MTDEELLKKLKKDKDRGLSAAIDLYSGLLYKIAATVILPVGSREDVEECVSDSFMSFYESIDSFDLSKASIRSYLAVITRRRSIDFYRRLKKAELVSLENAEKVQSEDFTSEVEAKNVLFAALRSLGEPDTTIVTRKYLFGEAPAQIAETLSMSEGAVQKRLERSREKLRRELGGVFNG